MAQQEQERIQPCTVLMVVILETACQEYSGGLFKRENTKQANRTDRNATV